MKNYLIGSRSLALQKPSFKIREHTDFDVISEKPLSENFEFHDVNFLNNYELDRYALKDPIVLEGHEVYPISMKGLAIVKRSHLWRDLSFDKHIAAYCHHLKNFMKDLNGVDRAILKNRTDETMKNFGSIYSLKKNKEDFFSDYVQRKYDHDYLHELFKYYSKPLYTRLQNVDGSVWCDVNKWNELSYKDKLKCVAEEVSVLAAERFLIPSDWKMNSKLAYLKGMKKVCTTASSGWFRDFAIDNFDEVFSFYTRANFLHVKNKLQEK